MNQQQLKTILSQHKLWLNDENGGKKANLIGAYLIGADLRDAYLIGADLRDADLRGADLRGADLRDAYLIGADLRDAYLIGADLRDAYLRDADLRGAYLRDAYLRDADLIGADLRDADLIGADLPHFQIVPTEGSFYAYKKTTKGVIKIQIPARAKRTNSLIGRKCRAEYVKVISGDGCGGGSPTRGELIYTKGEIIRADSYDDDIRIECTNGIHFYMTKQEAEEH